MKTTLSVLGLILLCWGCTHTPKGPAKDPSYPLTWESVQHAHLPVQDVKYLKALSLSQAMLVSDRDAVSELVWLHGARVSRIPLPLQNVRHVDYDARRGHVYLASPEALLRCRLNMKRLHCTQAPVALPAELRSPQAIGFSLIREELFGVTGPVLWQYRGKTGEVRQWPLPTATQDRLARCEPRSLEVSSDGTRIHVLCGHEPLWLRMRLKDGRILEERLHQIPLDKLLGVGFRRGEIQFLGRGEGVLSDDVLWASQVETRVYLVAAEGDAQQVRWLDLGSSPPR